MLVTSSAQLLSLFRKENLVKHKKKSNFSLIWDFRSPLKIQITLAIKIKIAFFAVNFPIFSHEPNRLNAANKNYTFFFSYIYIYII